MRVKELPRIDLLNEQYISHENLIKRGHKKGQRIFDWEKLISQEIFTILI